MHFSQGNVRVSVLLGLALLMFPCGYLFAEDPYTVVKTVSPGGTGGYDYVYADNVARRLYVPRPGDESRIVVYDLDTLQQQGALSAAKVHGAVVSQASGHGFASSNPVIMWDAKTLEVIKQIPVAGDPDGILWDSFQNRVYIMSHTSPNLTVIDAVSGQVIGTMDLSGEPEQAVSDGNGHIYVDVQDKDTIAEIDVASLSVTRYLSLQGRGEQCGGLAIDVANQVLFATCRKTQNMVILSSVTGEVLSVLPIGKGNDGAFFNPSTGEVFSSQGDGTLTIVKEKAPNEFKVEQTLATHPNARTLSLDESTGKIYLVTADFLPPASPQSVVQGRPNRGPMVPNSFKVLVVGK